MQNAKARWARTLWWIGLGGGVVMMLLAVFSEGTQFYALSCYIILLSTSRLLHPTRPRLAYLCRGLSFVALIAYFVLFTMRIRR